MPKRKLKWKEVSLQLEVATSEEMEEEIDAGSDGFLFKVSYIDESNIINDIEIRIKKRAINNNSTPPKDVKSEVLREEEETEYFEEEEEASTALLDKPSDSEDKRLEEDGMSQEQISSAGSDTRSSGGQTDASQSSAASDGEASTGTVRHQHTSVLKTYWTVKWEDANIPNVKNMKRFPKPETISIVWPLPRGND